MMNVMFPDLSHKSLKFLMLLAVLQLMNQKAVCTDLIKFLMTVSAVQTCFRK